MKTVTLRVLCEGVTEHNFVTQVLAPHLETFSIFARGEPLIARGGGVVSFEKLSRAIKADVGRSRPHQHVTTMIDLHKLGKYPGAERLPGESVSTRVVRIEARMAEGLPNPRFIPHIQVHEFEALIFAGLEQLAITLPAKDVAAGLAALQRDVRGRAPEEINEGEQTAPSKRLIQALPMYGPLKSVVGPETAKLIGLTRLRAACPHFGAWVGRLEALAETGR